MIPTENLHTEDWPSWVKKVFGVIFILTILGLVTGCRIETGWTEERIAARADSIKFANTIQLAPAIVTADSQKVAHDHEQQK
jgi:hypothetical protein